MQSKINNLIAKKDFAPIKVQTFGNFRVLREGQEVSAKDWTRDKAIQLFQFFITARQRRGLHKEQIVDRLWESDDGKQGAQNFKVALHGISKALEPDKKSRAESRYIIRQGITYQLNLEEIWIDADAIESFIALGNQALLEQPELAIIAYREAIELHQGTYLPNRLYDDWSSDERERLQVLALGAIITLSELLLEKNPMESIRLAKQALLLDKAWEDAYRIQMKAYHLKGNRPMAIKTYQKCVEVLNEEFGVEPLPKTKQLIRLIRNEK